MYPLSEKSLINSSVAGALQPTTWPYRCTPCLLNKSYFLLPLNCTQGWSPAPLSWIYTVGCKRNMYYLMSCNSKKAPLSAILFPSINKPDSALPLSTRIYVEWFEGFKTTSVLLFVFLVKCFFPSFRFGLMLNSFIKPFVLRENKSPLCMEISLWMTSPSTQGGLFVDKKGKHTQYYTFQDVPKHVLRTVDLELLLQR